MCVKVTYADGMEDLIEANEYHGERHQNKEVYKGRLTSTNGKAVVILNPDPNGKDLLVFKCAKVTGCTKFRVDLEVKIFYGNTRYLSSRRCFGYHFFMQMQGKFYAKLHQMVG